MVFHTNFVGTITSSDLKFAASVVHHDVLVIQVGAQEAIIHDFSDNTVTIYWQHKGAVSNSGSAARFLHLQALHQRWHCYVPTYDYLPCPANVISDECNRRWDFTDSQLLRHFNSSFPQTQS
jgi:hypothetical protein